MNSHIRALKQHNDPAPLSCTRLGCQTMGLKVKTFKMKKVFKGYKFFEFGFKTRCSAAERSS